MDDIHVDLLPIHMKFQNTFSVLTGRRIHCHKCSHASVHYSCSSRVKCCQVNIHPKGGWQCDWAFSWPDVSGVINILDLGNNGNGIVASTRGKNKVLRNLPIWKPEHTFHKVILNKTKKNNSEGRVAYYSTEV